MNDKSIDIHAELVRAGRERVVSVVNVWSNGNKIRRWAGQGEDSEWHSPGKGYRKMTAILVEEVADNE